MYKMDEIDHCATSITWKNKILLLCAVHPHKINTGYIINNERVLREAFHL